MAEHDAAPSGRGRPTGLWLKILLFAAGLVVGVLGVGLLNASTPDFAAATGSGNASTSPGQGGPDVPSGVQAQVNASCLAVINEAQDVYGVLGDLGPALDAVDLAALDDIVRRLQPIEPRLGRDLADCRIDTSVTSGDPSAGPGSPVQTPPATTAPTPTAAPAPTVPPAPTSAAPQPSATR